MLSGIRDDAARRKLLHTDDITYARACEIVLQYEAVRKHSRTIASFIHVGKVSTRTPYRQHPLIILSLALDTAITTIKIPIRMSIKIQIQMSTRPKATTTTRRTAPASNSMDHAIVVGRNMISSHAPLSIRPVFIAKRKVMLPRNADRRR